MKKLLVLVAVAALFASSASALTIVNSKHDLSATAAGGFEGTIDEICVYCHTPHGADISKTFAPLWNRTPIDATTFYNATAATTLDATIDLASVNATDAVLCLSCHDGAGVTAALKNPPNDGTTQGGTSITGNAALGTDLTNDHPIGFDYAAVALADSEILPQPASLNFYGAGSDMWCSSCHDVHSNEFTPFLMADNTQSALCLTCHNK